MYELNINGGATHAERQYNNISRVPFVILNDDDVFNSDLCCSRLCHVIALQLCVRPCHVPRRCDYFLELFLFCLLSNGFNTFGH